MYTKTFPDGSTYEGDFVSNKMHGQGKLIWSTGEQLSGAWENDHAVGEGLFFFSDGTRVEGKWRQRNGNFEFGVRVGEHFIVNIIKFENDGYELNERAIQPLHDVVIEYRQQQQLTYARIMDGNFALNNGSDTSIRDYRLR